MSIVDHTTSNDQWEAVGHRGPISDAVRRPSVSIPFQGSNDAGIRNIDWKNRHGESAAAAAWLASRNRSFNS